ncbi:response regulator [Halocola ammonii]
MNVKTILIDDDEIFIMMTRKMMESSNFHKSPISFASGESALSFMEENYSTSDVYILFLDINMPNMNGWEFLDKIERFVTKGNTYVFMTTSSIDDEDIAKAGENELVVKFLSKPVLTETFTQLKEIPELQSFFPNQPST